MASVERTVYPRFAPTPSARELARLYTPTPREIELAKRATRGKDQSPAFVVMLKSFQRLGYFPRPDEVPEAVAAHVRSRLGAGPDDPADLVNAAIEDLVKERFELPAFSTPDRLCRKIRYAVNAGLFAGVDEGLSGAERSKLDALLEVDGRGRSDPNVLKAPPKAALSNVQRTVRTIIEAIEDADSWRDGTAELEVA